MNTIKSIDLSSQQDINGYHNALRANHEGLHNLCETRKATISSLSSLNDSLEEQVEELQGELNNRMTQEDIDEQLDDMRRELDEVRGERNDARDQRDAARADAEEFHADCKELIVERDAAIKSAEEQYAHRLNLRNMNRLTREQLREEVVEREEAEHTLLNVREVLDGLALTL